MKICISVVTYYPQKNGIQFVTQNLAEGLVKKGHEVTVVTRIFREFKDDENINGVKVFRCNIKDKNMFYIGNKKEFQDKLISLSRNIDVMLFINLQSVAVAWALDILDSINCQKLLYLHGIHEFRWKKINVVSLKNFTYKILRDIRWGLFYYINRKKIDKFDKIIHIHTEDNSYKFFENRYPGKNYVLENFAEEMFYKKMNEKAISCDYYVYIANYHPNKNQMQLLEASYLMKNHIKIIFVGSEPSSYYDKLLKRKKELDKKYNIEKNISFLHNIPRSKLPDILEGAYGFVMTSKSEHYPVSLIEAMAVGVPIISTNVGIVKFLPGCIIVDDDLSDLSRKMDFLIDNKKKYEELKEEAILYAQNHFKFDNYLAEFERIVFLKSIGD